jgi:hypothetical protein
LLQIQNGGGGGISERGLNITSSENVGIGTTSPQRKLQVTNSADGFISRFTGGANSDVNIGIFGHSTSNFGSIGTETDDRFSLFTNGVDRLNITNTGNVGINTTSPRGKLQINGNANSWNEAPSIRLWDTTNSKGWVVGNVNNYTAGDFYIRTMPSISGDPSSAQQEFTIKHATGYVGIGTTTPTAPLHIEGGTNSEVLKIEADSSPYIRWVQNGTNVGFLQFLGGSAYLSNMSNGKLIFRTNNTDKMVITGGGNVGIGTTSPVQKLHVHNSVASSASYAKFSNAQTGTTSADGFDIGVNTSDQAIVWQRENTNLLFATNNTEKMRINSAGSVGIGTNNPSYKLDVTGTIRATGDIIAYSDVRVKENIKTIDNSLEKVSKLRGVEFNKIGDNEKSIGVIAQEIEKIIPEVVKEDDKGMKSVAYGNISGLLIEAIKELKAK